MKSANWKDIAELLGIAAIVASLIFVGLQMRQDQEIAITGSYSSVVESAASLATLMEAHSEIWRNGLDGKELSDVDELKFLAMVEVVEEHFVNMLLRFYRLNIIDPEVVVRDYAYAIYVHPGLRRAFSLDISYRESQAAAFNMPIFEPAFRSQVILTLDELDKMSPEIPAIKQYIFW